MPRQKIGNSSITASNSAFWVPAYVSKTANVANQTALFGNTTMGAIVPKLVIGQVAVNNSSIQHKGEHSGWNIKKTGTGPIVSITVSAGGTTYSNTDLIRVTSTGTGSVNATGTLTTNATGGITAIALTNPGVGFVTVNPSVAVTNSTGGATGGSGATLVAKAGGRAGRVNYETIVAMGSLS